MEQLPGVKWFWRWRIAGGYPPPYLQWREGSCSANRLMLHSEIPGCEIQAEWRDAGDAPWRQAALHECARGRARFLVKAQEDFIMPQGFRAMADVGGHVACYHFPAMELRAGVETIVEAVADGPYPENVLLAAGEFRPVCGLVSIENVGKSAGSLVPVSASRPLLSRIPGAEKRMLYAIAAKGQNKKPIRNLNHA